MKIAVLLTGRMCRFDEIYKRINHAFDIETNSVDYFCHTWNDDFVDLKSANNLEDIYHLLIPNDPRPTINLIDPKAVLLSSYQEILDIINDGILHINDPQFNLSIDNILFYINYLAPQLSTYYAMQSLKSYVNETGTVYDVVIKWRYDLLTEKMDFQHEIKTDTLYTANASEDLMDDRFYYGNYSTMFRLLDQCKLEFNKELLYTFYHMSDLGDLDYKSVINKFNHAWFYNRMLLASLKAVIPELRIEEMYSSDDLVIFRKYFNKDANLKDMLTFNKKLFNHKHGWNKKVLSNETVEFTWRDILVAGCSHVFGHGMSDCLTFNPTGDYQPSKFAWPHLLGEWSSSNIVNLSKPGNSLGKIAYDILNYKNFKRLSGIIIVLPTSERFMIKGDDREVDTFLASNKYYGDKLNSIGYYLEHLHSDEINKLNYVSQISYIVSMANAHKIPIWISAGSQIDHDWITSIENIPFSLNTRKSWYQYYSDLGYTLTPDRHFDSPAHTDFFENFIKPWVDKNILSVERQLIDDNNEMEFKFVKD
jgi:hypothetical protein